MLGLFWWLKSLGQKTLVNPATAIPIGSQFGNVPVKKLPLAESQYIKVEFPKKYIFLHHTAGGSVASAVGHWASKPDRIATPYVIERDGGIYETFDPKFWAYSLGVPGYSSLEKNTIAIEIVSFGNLTKNAKGEYVAWTGRIIPAEEVVAVDFRGYKYYHKYTDAQIGALKLLIPYLMKTFNIQFQTIRKDFWLYRLPSTLTPGIWSHSTVRTDKVDIFPQKELVEIIYNL